jgi:hypothetical protein
MNERTNRAILRDKQERAEQSEAECRRREWKAVAAAKL